MQFRSFTAIPRLTERGARRMFCGDRSFIPTPQCLILRRFGKEARLDTDSHRLRKRISGKEGDVICRTLQLTTPGGICCGGFAIHENSVKSVPLIGAICDSISLACFAWGGQCLHRKIHQGHRFAPYLPQIRLAGLSGLRFRGAVSTASRKPLHEELFWF